MTKGFCVGVVLLALASGCRNLDAPKVDAPPATVTFQFTCTWLGADVLKGTLIVYKDALDHDPAYYTGNVSCEKIVRAAPDVKCRFSDFKEN